MLTQNITQELESVLQALHQEGKTPTVALVKARLTTPVPIPALIVAIRSWKSTQRVPKVEVATKEALSNDEKISRLEQQVRDLTLRLEQLENQLQEKA